MRYLNKTFMFSFEANLDLLFLIICMFLHIRIPYLFALSHLEAKQAHRYSLCINYFHIKTKKMCRISVGLRPNSRDASNSERQHSMYDSIVRE